MLTVFRAWAQRRSVSRSFGPADRDHGDSICTGLRQPGAPGAPLQIKHRVLLIPKVLCEVRESAVIWFIHLFVFKDL